MSKNRWIIFVFLFLFHFPLAAAALSISCGKDGEIQQIAEQEMAVVKKNKGDFEKSNKVALKYDFIGPNKQKASPRYDLNKIRNLVDLAVDGKIDPFLVIAIGIMENPPLIDSSKDSLRYESNYGAIPIDDFPLLDALGCLVNPRKKPENPKLAQSILAKEKQLQQINDEYKELEKNIPEDVDNKITGLVEEFEDLDQLNSLINSSEKTEALCRKYLSTKECKMYRKYIEASVKLVKVSFEYGTLNEGSSGTLEFKCQITKNCRAIVGAPKKERTFKVSNSSAAEFRKYCYDRTYIDVGGGHARLEMADKKSEMKCCVNVRKDPNQNEEYIDHHVKNSIAIGFIGAKMKSVKPGTITRDIQKYNGVGCFDCTEDGENNCLSGIHLGDRPFYGARVADIMVNMLMNNPEIVRLVASAAVEKKVSIKSLFCQSSQEGKNLIDSDQFLNEQKQYLLDGSNRRFKIRLPDGQVAVPQTAKELGYYKLKEAQRRKTCRKTYFDGLGDDTVKSQTAPSLRVQ